MKKVFKALEVNEKDNWFTAYNKGAVKGYGVGLAVVGLAMGTLKLLSKHTDNEEKLDTFEEILKKDLGA